MKTQDEKLDEILALSREANRKMDVLGSRVDNLDRRLLEVEQRLDKLGIKAMGAGAIGGAIVAIGIELIKARFLGG